MGGHQSARDLLITVNLVLGMSVSAGGGKTWVIQDADFRALIAAARAAERGLQAANADTRPDAAPDPAAPVLGDPEGAARAIKTAHGSPDAQL